ncbi:hypothetical protein J2853_000596 [Streptosporangium lutulentum]|uniref:Uncharacterized protein n=1 Tax=Streptosporangium lutulentum TaxID=1461250 RepID=A0ABT9Q4K8_9ACTN|nr:hypothetical protein [Streptosporangium lutulentum]
MTLGESAVNMEHEGDPQSPRDGAETERLTMVAVRVNDVDPAFAMERSRALHGEGDHV